MVYAIIINIRLNKLLLAFIEIECATNYVDFWTQVSIWSHARIEIFKIQSYWKVMDNDRVHVLVCFIIFFVQGMVTFCLFEK